MGEFQKVLFTYFFVSSSYHHLIQTNRNPHNYRNLLQFLEEIKNLLSASVLAVTFLRIFKREYVNFHPIKLKNEGNF